jgi:hypothetical protein
MLYIVKNKNTQQKLSIFYFVVLSSEISQNLEGIARGVEKWEEVLN